MKIITIIGILITACAVTLVYDARQISRKFFGFGDQNEGTLSLKIVGFILSIIGGVMIIL